MTPEDAADILEGIARLRRAKSAVEEIAGRVVIAESLEKASGLDVLRKLAPDEVPDEPHAAVSGAAVVRALTRMCREQHLPPEASDHS